MIKNNFKLFLGVIIVFALFAWNTVVMFIQGSTFSLHIVLLSICILISAIILLCKSRHKYMEIAYKDSLTGVYSRAYLEKWIEENKSRRGNMQSTSTIVIIDIDNFKDINDNHGHAVGDQTLVKIAEAFVSSIRKEDVIVRYGGDEFILILDQCDEKHTKTIIERAIKTLNTNNELEFEIQVSFGIAQMTNKDSFFQTLQSADLNMYKQKNHKPILL